MPEPASDTRSSLKQTPRAPSVTASDKELDTWPNRPRSLVALSVIYIALTPLENLSGPFGSPLQVIGIAFLCVWTLSLLSRRHRFRLPFRAALPMLLIVAWSALTVTWSWNESVSIGATVSYASLTLSAIAVADTYRSHFRLPLIALAIGTVCLSAYLLVAGRVDINGQTQVANVDENITAFSLSLGGAAIAYLAISTTRLRSRILWVASLLLVTAALLIVGSRTGVGSIILLGILAAALVLGSPRRAATVLVSVIAGFVLFNELRNAALIPERILLFLNAPVATDSRTEIIDAFLLEKNVWQNFGVGTGADADFLLATFSWYKDAHSGFWRIWIESGLVGLALWSLLIVTAIRGVVRGRQWTFFILAAAPIGLFMYSLGPIYSNMLWVVLGLALTGFRRSFAGRQPKYQTRSLV